MRGAPWILVALQSFCTFMGLMPFAFDFKTGIARKANWRTLYTLSVNLLTIVVMVIDFSKTVSLKKSGLFQQQLYEIIGLIRGIAAVATVALNWFKRDNLMCIMQDFHALWRRYLQQFHVQTKIQRRFERAVIWKSGLSTYKLFARILLSGVFTWYAMNWTALLSLVNISMVVLILDLVVAQYHLTISCCNLCYDILHAELQRLLCVMKLSQPQYLKRGAYMTRCCQLADQFDDLAAAHHELQKMVDRLNASFEWQSAAVVLSMYLHNIYLCYFAYACFQPNSYFKDRGLPGLFFLLTGLLVYYADLAIFSSALFRVQEAWTVSTELMKRQLVYRKMDERLEQSCERFSLQLARSPLRVKLLGLFYFNQQQIFVLFASTVTTSVFLMQYDIQHFH